MNKRLDEIAGLAHCIAAQRLASALTLGIDNCQAEERPLTQLQIIDLWYAALVEFDGCRAEIEGQLQAHTLLAGLADRDRVLS